MGLQSGTIFLEAGERFFQLVHRRRIAADVAPLEQAVHVGTLLLTELLEHDESCALTPGQLPQQQIELFQGARPIGSRRKGQMALARGERQTAHQDLDLGQARKQFLHPGGSDRESLGSANESRSTGYRHRLAQAAGLPSCARISA